MLKNSIAKKVTVRVSFMLVLVMLVMLSGVFVAVRRAVSDELDTYAVAILDIFTDYLDRYTNDRQIPISTDIADDVTGYGEKLCRNYDADYLYIYSIGDDNRSVFYSAVAIGEIPEKEKGFRGRFTGRVECELVPEELAVWNGEKDLGHIVYRAWYGDEISILRPLEDCKGNRFIVGVDVSLRAVTGIIVRNFAFIALAVVLIIAAIGVAVYFIIRKRVSEPAQIISRSMNEYIKNGERSNFRLEDGGSDEFALIASSFNSMTDDIARYVNDIKDLTKEQANRQTELEIAAGIQRGLLPADRMSSCGCEIRAMMSPAKYIGGDLYDYIDLGGGRYLTVIADVSGKGVSAAMFMSATLTLIRQFAKMGLDPAGILKETNEALTENNPQMLFVTAFVGIYDSGNRAFTYSNAGHNIPYIIGEKLKKLDGAAGTLLGLFEGEEYINETVTILPGDTVFLYTDGVNEAINTERVFWGEERLEQTLHEFRSSGSANPVEYVYSAVRSFADGAEQNDDITMLALTVKENTVSLELSCDTKDFEKIKGKILGLPIPRKLQLELCLAAEEVFVNICSYAFEGKSPEYEKIIFTLNCTDKVTMKFSDSGIPFNPLEDNALPGNDSELSSGGLGRYISMSLTDESKYEYRDGKNNLTLIKYIEEEDK